MQENNYNLMCEVGKLLVDQIEPIFQSYIVNGLHSNRYSTISLYLKKMTIQFSNLEAK